MIVLKKLLISLFVTFVVFLFFPQKTQAAAFSFNIASSSATVITFGSQDIEASLNILNLPSESYFRIALQKESGGSYYGYVLNNNGDWAKIQTLSGDCAIYYKVSDILTTSLFLKYRIGDDIEIANGNYYLKAHRFTKTCTSYTEATNSLSIEVSFPTPTLTPTPTPTPQPTATSQPTNTPIPQPPSSTPVPTITIKPSSTPKPSLTPTLTLTPTATASAEILGATTSGEIEITETPTETPVETMEDKKNGNFKILPFLLIVPGAGMIGFAVFSLLKSKKIL